MDNCTTLLVQFWKVKNPEIHREQSKRNTVTSQTKKKDLFPIDSWEKFSPVFQYFSFKACRGFPPARGNLFPPPLDFMHSP